MILATPFASFRERLLVFRSCWIVFIHIVRGHPGGLFQFSNGEAIKILAAVLSDVHILCGPTRRNAILDDSRKVWLVGCLTSWYVVGEK